LVTVGEALTEARYRAGLTVAELSERTRIREAVISSIEQDDYEACGGDLYVRGYVRAIAGAIGVDAQPLIRAYDEGRAAPGRLAQDSPAQNGSAPAGPPQISPAQNGSAPAGPAHHDQPKAGPAHHDQPPAGPPVQGPPVQGPAEEGRSEQGPPADAGFEPADDLADTRFDLPVITVDPPAADPAQPAATATQAALPVKPGRTDRTDRPDRTATADQPRQPDQVGRRSRLATWWGVPRNRRVSTVVAVVLALALIVTHDVVDGLRAGTPAGKSTASAKQAGTRHPGTNAGARAGTSGNGTGTSNDTGSGDVRTSPALDAKPLGIERAMAFGPLGTSDGDNPELSAYAIRSGSSQPWQTDWYITPRFDALRSGTGLLITMDHTYTIVTVRIDLGQYRGANLQLRAGHEPVFGDMRVVATASDAGGTLRLTLRTPVSARYLLIWFTRLPPIGTGRYQASVYGVVVDGRP
jgi:transcriptional regulator with XRE-family HTH domain